MRLTKKGSKEIPIESWFLGPKAENADLLEDLLVEAFRDHIFWRRNFHPEDDSPIPESTRRSKAFQDSVALLKEEFAHLLASLKLDIPFYSPRYIGHMLGDQLIPAIVGYVATLLYNPNNVSSEGSPVTTRLEIEVGQQLARLIGYRTGAWGHITSGGTLANFEGLLVARNLKYFPLAIQEFARDQGLTIEIRLLNGQSKPLLFASPWELLNLSCDESVALSERVITEYARVQGISCEKAKGETSRQLASYTISGKGIHSFFQDHRDALKPGVIITSGTAHYSLLKIVRALGIGEKQLVSIPVGKEFRMDTGRLEEELYRCSRELIPVIAVVPVCGSTEESSVDLLHEIVAIRTRFEKEHGLTFFLHCDAAYGGYVMTLFVDKNGRRLTQKKIQREMGGWPSKEIYESFCALSLADSICIDPHKLGYIPYPAGAILFRNGQVRTLISSTAPYIFSETGDSRDTSIGPYIFEGSKPGAAAAACYLAHRVVPLNSSGYGAIIGKSIQSARRLFTELTRLRSRLEKSAISLVPLACPDINIVCFMVNRLGNRSLMEMNRINHAIYDKLKFLPDRPIQDHNFVISRTDLTHDKYGESLASYLKDAGIEDHVDRVTVLRCTVMNPWFTATQTQKSHYLEEFIDELEKVIRQTVCS